ncbi:L-threonylcarbamoyladenylate synthase [Marinobacter sp. TBZ242]|uniref:Threonylcarbamoyl-AMP synthase n=1 Tax=Marinobacter azerbaijanicus TaxID=3050455 RepID=A0ABT7IEZ4_9GAMM|nr:L-threonylcarbamoyladenylate synthase [Marinobacter sp. TBZ242]MDL0431699.1 L-threonylcarbamoyladenylate synthase [Marinobacter sp. TBZ242]
MIELDAGTPGDVEHAASLLRQGHIIAIPTETVYGLAADAGNPAAIKKVFEAKQRPIGHPLIVHLSDPERIHQWVDRVPDFVWPLIEEYWPGPLTILLPKKYGVSDFITGGQPGVALRMPAHPVALETLRLLGGDIVAPSANPYGRISPTSASHVLRGMAGRIRAVLDGGNCSVGIESTILDLTGEVPSIARPGVIGRSELERFLGMSFPDHAPAKRAVPGNVKHHYQPVTPTIGVPPERFPEALPELTGNTGRTGVIWWQSPPPESAVTESIRLGDNPEDYARMLYTAMHAMDQADLARIIIELPPKTEPWLAIHDRLGRACTQSSGAD